MKFESRHLILNYQLLLDGLALTVEICVISLLIGIVLCAEPPERATGSELTAWLPG